MALPTADTQQLLRACLEEGTAEQCVALHDELAITERRTRRRDRLELPGSLPPSGPTQPGGTPRRAACWIGSR